MNTSLINFNWKTQYDTDTEFKDAIDALCTSVLGNLPEWSGKITGNPLRTIPLLNDIPMVCKGSECPFAVKCEVLRAVKDSPSEMLKLIGTSCRIEEVLIPKYFMDYLQLLQIKPVDIGDILEVANLVSLIVHRRRIELDISIHGINERMVVGVSQGKSIIQRTNNPSYKLLESINKQIASIESQLATSRKDRMSMENKNVDKLKEWIDNIQKNAPKPTKKVLSIEEANNIISES